MSLMNIYKKMKEITRLELLQLSTVGRCVPRLRCHFDCKWSQWYSIFNDYDEIQVGEGLKIMLGFNGKRKFEANKAHVGRQCCGYKGARFYSCQKFVGLFRTALKTF